MQRTIVTVLVTAVVFALAGWFAASIKPEKVVFSTHAHGSKDCKDKDCDVEIKFECIGPISAATCQPYAVEDVILVSSGYKINFTIDKATDFDFDSTDGIKFTSANADNYFPCQPRGRQKYQCADNAPVGTAVYKYWIHVQGMAIVDPFAVNY